MSKSAVVLGAAGSIGRHTCRELVLQGFTVHGIGHGNWLEEEWRTWGISSWTCASISDASLQHATSGLAAPMFFHCAGSGAVSASYANPYLDFERTVNTTVVLLDFVRRCFNSESRVVLASSAAVYGDQGDIDLAESAAHAPVSPYGFHKAAAESIADSYSRFFGLQVSVVRLFSVYGEGLEKQLLWDAMNKLIGASPSFFGSGNELRDWIHVDDAARLLCAAGVRSEDAWEVFNGGAVKVNINTVMTKLNELTGNRRFISFTGETHSGNPRRLAANSSHSIRQLGWRPLITLDEGLSRYVTWFKSRTHK